MDASFGNRSSSNYDWETLFGGYRYDGETGLYQVRYRYLHSKLGRWLNRDPIGEKGGVNLYGFVSNDPVQKSDRLGLAACGNCGEVVTAALVRTLGDIRSTFAGW